MVFSPLSIPYPQWASVFLRSLYFVAERHLQTAANSALQKEFIDMGGMVISSCTYIGICGCIQFLLLVEWKLSPVTTADRLILQKLLAKKVFYQTI